MSEENENTPTPEDSETGDLPNPESDPTSQPDAAHEDAPSEAAEPSSDEADALAAAMAAVSQVQGVADSATSATDAQPFESPDFGDAATSASKQGLDLLSDVHMDVRIELGRTKMFVEDVLKLGDGAVVELDKLAGDPVDVFVNDRKVARGEVLVLNDLFCVRISEIVDISAAEA
jgi:flagellar motor switch protein FliN